MIRTDETLQPVGEWHWIRPDKCGEYAVGMVLGHRPSMSLTDCELLDGTRHPVAMSKIGDECRPAQFGEADREHMARRTAEIREGAAA